MIKIFLFIIAWMSMYLYFPTLYSVPKKPVAKTTTVEDLFPDGQSSIPSINTLINIRKLLSQDSNQLDPKVIDKVLTVIQCTNQFNIEHNNILTIIDYSLPANKKRLWVFDLYAPKLLFNTYVSHGIKSGALISNYFSNRNNSKASSIGVYKTEKSYYGREGLSLRLDGIDPRFNDNASYRSVVMHGGWYVDEKFIQKYGRPGRSWGCPALPLTEYKPIINTIKDNSLFVVYYPNEQWLDTSKFLHCAANNPAIKTTSPAEPYIPVEKEARDEVLFAPLKIKTKAEGKEAVVAISAENYQQFFHVQPPLERMLRRQISGMEYIALSEPEINKMVSTNDVTFWKTVNFVIPVLIMIRGYYETQMQIINLGTIKEIKLESNKEKKRYTVYFSDNKPSQELRVTSQFVRWLGL